VVDDDEDDRKFLERDLVGEGYQVKCLEVPEEAINVLPGGNFRVVVLDNRFHASRMSGMDCLRELRRRGVAIPVIVLTGHGGEGFEETIESMRLGAFKYVRKPLSWDKPYLELLQLVRKAAEQAEIITVPVSLPGRPTPAESDAGSSVVSKPMLGTSKVMLALGEFIARVAIADYSAPALIRGESGTGKELAARALFHYSRRKGKTFLAVNCSWVPEALEQELFGRENSILGPQAIGVFEQADGGAVLLDEVAALSPDVQGKLLNLLERGEIIRRGAHRPIKVDVRIIASTTRDLNRACDEGTFRRDLYNRLNAVPIEVRPLRERVDEQGDDRELLAQYFLKQAAAEQKRPLQGFHPEALAKIRAYRWPGNVRELQDKVSLAVVLCQQTHIMPEDLQLEPNDTIEGEAAVHIRRACEIALKSRQQKPLESLKTTLLRELCQLARTLSGGNDDQAARVLGLPLDEFLELHKRFFAHPVLHPSRARAYQVYELALRVKPQLAGRTVRETVAKVFRWLKEESPDVDSDKLPTNVATFAKYIREAEAFHAKNPH
jgi:DNA-binding NtrC family response regulator